MDRIRVDGTNLHYVSKGHGDALVFVHAGLEDLRLWEPHVDYFASEQYRAVAYSRRYNYPNSFDSINPDHSAISESDDLAGLITGLGLGKVHVAGASYGAYTALMLAVRHPDLVSSLVLSEAPVISWLPDIAGGSPVYEDFYAQWWRPAARAFETNDIDRALEITIDWWGAHGASMGDVPFSWVKLPDEYRQLLRDNANDLRAMVLSRDAFPGPSRDEVSAVHVPTLMLSGSQTIALHRLIDSELERTLPMCIRREVQAAGHEMWSEQPDECRAQTLDFIRSR